MLVASHAKEHVHLWQFNLSCTTNKHLQRISGPGGAKLCEELTKRTKELTQIRSSTLCNLCCIYVDKKSVCFTHNLFYLIVVLNHCANFLNVENETPNENSRNWWCGLMSPCNVEMNACAFKETKFFFKKQKKMTGTSRTDDGSST